MLRNKAFLMSHTFNRTKLFHSKKGWLITSALFFALLGAFAVNASANANTTQQPVNSNKVITKKANNLLNNIVANAATKPNNTAELKSTSTQNNNQNANPSNLAKLNNLGSKENNSAKVATTLKVNSDNSQINKTTASSQNNVKKANFGVELGSTPSQHNEENKASDSHWIYDNSTQQYASDTQFNDWKTNAELSQAAYYGLNWQYSQKANAVEFTSGKLDSDVANATVDGPFGYNIQNPTIRNAKSLKFDSAVDTSNLTSLRNLFGGNGSVYSLDLGPNFNTQNVTNMQAAFQGNTNLRYLNFGDNFNTSNVTNMNSMFNNDPSLVDLNLNSFNTGNVTDMANMFTRDTNIKSLTFPSIFSANKVTTMHSMFESDENLSDLNLSSFNTTSDLTDTGWMFCSDFNLKSVNIPNTFHTSNVTSMDSMFWNDHSLQSLTLPESFDTSNVTNMSGMFNNNYNLKSLNLPSTFNGNKVTTMHSMFESDFSLSDLDLSSLKTSSDLTDLGWMFCDDGALKSLEFPEGFNTNSVTSMASMFWGAGSLQKIIFSPLFNTSNVVNMDGMLNSSALNQLTIKSNGTKFNSEAFSTPINMYKQLSNNTYSDTPNNFLYGNIGTFVAGYIAFPITNPNDTLAKTYPTLTDNQWNQNYHFNNPEGQNNDIESIIPHKDDNGEIDYWDVYYLWNPDPGNPGQSAYDEWGWARATPDFKQFYPVDINNPVSLKNVAIPNPEYEINGQNRIEVNSSDIPVSIRIPWHQVAGGSVIPNKHGNGQWLTHDVITGNPIDQNARLAYFANYGNNDDCYLAYANPIYSNGTIVGYKQFRPYSEQNVFTTKTSGAALGNTRDPYVIINPENHNQLLAYCAGGTDQKIYVLSSSDAVNWVLASSINVHKLLNYTLNNNDSHNINSAETPYVAILNGTPILFMSEQDTSDKDTEGIIYATGSLNNGIFQLSPNSHIGRVDLGHDVYAGNFAQLNDNELVFIGWSNSWAYFNGKHAGGFTLPRYISWNNSTNTLNSTPIEPIINNLSDRDNNGNFKVNGKVSIKFNQPTNNFDITFSRINNARNNVEFKFNNGKFTVTRQGSANGVTDLNDDNFVNLTINKLSNVQFYLDNDTIEAYLPDVSQMYTVLDYDDTRNMPYKVTGIPSNAGITSYQFKDDTIVPEDTTNVQPSHEISASTNDNNQNEPVPDSSTNSNNTANVPSTIITPNATNVPSNNSIVTRTSLKVSNVVSNKEQSGKGSNGHYATVPNNFIALTDVTRRNHFYVHGHAVKITRKAAKNTKVLSAYLKSHKIQYTVKIGKLIGHIYGYIKNIKPSFMNRKHVKVQISNDQIARVATRNVKIISAARKGSNVTYHVAFKHMKHIMHGVIYAKVTKRIFVKCGTYKKTKLSSEYYPVRKVRYGSYTLVKKPCMVHSSKNFTKGNAVKSLHPSIMLNVKRIVRIGNMTRFVLNNGGFITGLKRYMKLY